MAEDYIFSSSGSSSSEYVGFTTGLFTTVTQGVTCQAVAISRSPLELTGNLEKNRVTFTLPSSNSFAKSLLYDAHQENWLVTIYKNGAPKWYGRVLSTTLQGRKIAITTDSSERKISRNPTGARFSLHCWKNLYSETCGVNKAAFLTSLSGTAVGDYVTVAGGLTENFFAGGILEMNGESRRILSNSATVLQLANRLMANGVGTISLYPGCSLTSTNCTAFGNLINFGGFEYIPFVNPTDRSGIL